MCCVFEVLEEHVFPVSVLPDLVVYTICRALAVTLWVYSVTYSVIGT